MLLAVASRTSHGAGWVGGGGGVLSHKGGETWEGEPRVA